MIRSFRNLCISLLAVVGFLPAAHAQNANTPFSASSYTAAAFSSVYAIPSVSPNVYSFSRANCSLTAQGVNFFPFATNAPVFIQDSDTTKNEVLTPSAVSLTSSSCGVTISPANSHSTFTVKSGTGGLQEAVNATKSTGSLPTPIILDRNFHSYVAALPNKSSAGVVGAIASGAGTFLVDVTTSPYTYWSWPSGGSAYVLSSGKALPTFAATAGAGSGAAISATSGSGNYLQFTLTTGTGTATGSIFTLTYPTTASFNYAATCTLRSIGTNTPVGTITLSPAYGSQLVVTGSIATTALTASTAYVFAVRCN